MRSDAALDFYRRHGPLSDPGRHAPALAGLSPNVHALAEFVRGLLIHGDWLELYGLSNADFPGASRSTLPVAERFDALLAIDPSALTEPRAARHRSVGTCRDDALMLCALLRATSVPARVRCGFANYFEPNRYEDHWVCEYWDAGDKRWALADAQLDAEHCHCLGVRFDTTNLPTGTFVNAAEAWRLFETRAIAGDAFGHGDATGAWFLRVNLERDLRALRKQEISDWDSWREALPSQRMLNSESTVRCHTIAAAISMIDTDYPRFQRKASALCENEAPFWQ